MINARLAQLLIFSTCLGACHFSCGKGSAALFDAGPPAVAKARATDGGRPPAILKIDDTHFMLDESALLQASLSRAEIVATPDAGGFRLVDIAPGSIFRSLGLAPGDVVVSAEGIRIADEESWLQAYDLAKKSGEGHLDIVRAGARMTLSYRLPAIPPAPSAAPIGPAAPFRILPGDIRRMSDKHFVVKRSFVTRWAAADDLKGGRHLVPQPDSVRLIDVGEDSTMAKLGLRENDILYTVNGKNISSPAEVLEAYSLVRSEKQLVLALTRQGKPTAIVYDLIDG
jgi:S1-C subfamily serine protease